VGGGERVVKDNFVKSWVDATSTYRDGKGLWISRMGELGGK
jgi:hypothetical protein